MLKQLRALSAAMALCAVTALGLHTTEANAQATALPPGKQCFQATTGLTGMIGTLGNLVGGFGTQPSGTYFSIPLTGGTGTGATANITVSGGSVSAVQIASPGVNYSVNDTLSATASGFNTITGFAITVISTTINSSLAGGTVGMYIPGTLTVSQTWQNASQTILNANPIQLDINGCAVIFGIGSYRQILYDNLGNRIWDQVVSVAPVNPFWAGTSSGTANAITVTDATFSSLDGQSIQFIANATNTGSTTINPSGHGAIPVYKNTSAGPVLLSGGEIVTGNLVTVTYSSTFSRFLLSSYVGIVDPNSLPARQISPLSFGAKCNGVTDDTTAFQAAINSLSSRGGEINVPNLTCNISGTLTMVTSGLHIVGAGPGATVLNFTGTGATDAFKIGQFPTLGNCVGSSPPATCGQSYNLSIQNMTVNAASRTGGSLFNVNGASQVTISDIFYTAWALTETQFVNNVIFERMNGAMNATSGYNIYLHNSITSGTTAGWYRSDVITFNDVDMNAQTLGSVCIQWDGMVNTVRIDKMALISCNYGMSVVNSAASLSYFPSFLVANDLEIDGACGGGISINGGRDFQIVNSYVNTFGCANVVGHYPLGINPDTGGSFTSGVYISNSTFRDSGGGAAFIGAKDVNIDNSGFFDSNHAATGTYVAIELLPSAQSVIISNTFAGQRYGDPDAPSYGIAIDVGAGPVALDNMNFSGAVTNNINNLSASAVGWVGGIKNGGAINTATSCAAATAC